MKYKIKKTAPASEKYARLKTLLGAIKCVASDIYCHDTVEQTVAQEAWLWKGDFFMRENISVYLMPSKGKLMLIMLKTLGNIFLVILQTQEVNIS